ncbi:hypothetical protein ACM0IS_02785 [Mycoplasma aquilae ATCC BAA-1896]
MFKKYFVPDTISLQSALLDNILAAIDKLKDILDFDIIILNHTYMLIK